MLTLKFVFQIGKRCKREIAKNQLGFSGGYKALKAEMAGNPAFKQCHDGILEGSGFSNLKTREHLKLMACCLFNRVDDSCSLTQFAGYVKSYLGCHPRIGIYSTDCQVLQALLKHGLPLLSSEECGHLMTLDDSTEVCLLVFRLSQPVFL